MSQSGDLADCDAATSRSSAKRVASVVSKFNDLKRKLVSDIGFSGILHMPQINKTPRKFTVWLLSKVDLPSKSIVVNGRCKVQLTDEAFQRVLGIPCGPKKLVGLDTNEVQDKVDFIKLALGSISTDPLETCSLKVAEDIVSREYADGMNKEQMDRFKVAFVVFVVGHFLVAKTRTNHGIEEFWGSLLNTDEIHLHNFCALVIDEILESATRVQDELRAKRTIKNVTGCTLGLQVLYLDSLKLSEFELPRHMIPRIALFDLGLLKKLINADQENNISYCQNDTAVTVSLMESGSKKRVRFEGDNDAASTKPAQLVFRTPQPAVSTYLTAYLNGSIEQKLTHGQVDALKWHNARMTYHVRRTKQILFEGGGFNLNKDGFKTLIEVHMEELMSKIFQDNLSLAQRLHNNTETTSTPCQHNSIFSSSFNASSGYNSHKSEGCSSNVQRSFNESGTSSNNNCDRRSDFTHIVGKQLFNEETNISAKRVKQEHSSPPNNMRAEKSDIKKYYEPFIISEDAICAIIENGSRNCVAANFVQKLKCRQKRMAPNPWKMGARRKVVSTSVTNDLYYWLQNNNMSILMSNWIIHALPKYIELNGYHLKDIFIKGNSFSTEAFDIAIRRMVQLDRLMYGPGRKLCWRHIMESDFATLVLENKDPLESISIIYQFTMRLNEYDISECRMLVFPALVNCTWCAYYWDMEEHKVHVIDPMFENDAASSVKSLHKMNIEKIQAALSKVISLLFDGWNVNFSGFEPHFVQPIVHCAKRGSDGLLTLLSIQEFDGSKYVETQNEGTIEAFNKLVLYEMVSLEENYGNLPAGYTQSIS